MKTKLLLLIFAFCVLNFAQGANYYWVGGTGNWSNYSTHWATTSGGNVFHVQVPTSFDNVYFDANSFTAPGQIVTNDTTIAYCRDMDWTGAANNPTFEAANINIELKIFGSLTLNPVMNFSFNGDLTFTSFNPGKTIQTFSRVLQCPIEFNGAGGEWTLLDSLTTTKKCSLTYGTLRTNNHNMRCLSFYSYNNNARSLYLGTSTVSITNISSGDWYVNGSLVIDADSSVIRLRDRARFKADNHIYNIIQWDSTVANPSNYNTVDGHDLRINKIISLNSSINAELRFDFNVNNWVDSVICKSQLSLDFGGPNYFNYMWGNHNAEIREYGADTIMKMVIDENLDFTFGGNHFIHDLTVGDNLTISQGQSWLTFDSCRVYSNATILSANNQLGIFTMTPGKTLTLKNDSTQYIDSLSATGNPGFPIQIVSSDLGHAANVVIQKDLCTNYLYIHAVHATSPGFLFVGTNSNDVANNSGWIFNNCITGIENVDDASLSVFPNPATSELKIKIEKLKIEKIELYNTLGEKVYFQQPETSNHQPVTVNVSPLTPGIYFVKVKGNNSDAVVKFVKQ